MIHITQNTEEKAKGTHFIWLEIDKKKAISLLTLNTFEIYNIREDQSESLITEISEINQAEKICIEVGHINPKELIKKENPTKYSYAILKRNYPDLARETTLLPSPYKPTKYALIEKIVHADGSENISRIVYKNYLIPLTESLEQYVSWYNYITNKSKSIQGYISDLN